MAVVCCEVHANWSKSYIYWLAIINVAGLFPAECEVSLGMLLEAPLPPVVARACRRWATLTINLWGCAISTLMYLEYLYLVIRLQGKEKEVVTY